MLKIIYDTRKQGITATTDATQSSRLFWSIWTYFPFALEAIRARCSTMNIPRARSGRTHSLRLETCGQPAPDNDLWIAATAIRHSIR